MTDRAIQLYFINGRLMQKELIGDGASVWDEKYIDVTEEVKAALFGGGKTISHEELEREQLT